MTAVVDLHQSDFVGWEYLLVIQGLPFAWWSGTDPGDLGSSYLPHGVVIKPGLEVPRQLKVEGDFREAALERNRATFRIADIDNSLVALFKSEFADGELESVTEALRPETDPAPANLDKEAGGTVPLAGRNIGNEYIHTDLTRNARYTTPSDVPPGPDHAVHFAPGGPPTLPRVFVSDNPYTFKGRRVALYRIVFDHTLEVWPTWQEQYDGGSKVWDGTMKDTGELVEIRKWSINCAGPNSWLSKPLNANRPTIMPSPDSSVNLTEAKAGVAMSASHNIELQGQPADFVERLFLEADNLVGTSKAELTIEINLQISNLINDAAGDGLGWKEDNDARNVQLTAGGTFGVKIEGDADDNRGGIFIICLHIETWLAIGWDPAAQTSLEKTDGLWCEAIPIDEEQGGEGKLYLPFNQQGTVPPGSGYWRLTFTTVRKNEWGTELNKNWDNGGAMRRWDPLWVDGTVVMSPDSGQRLRFGIDPFWLEGQKAHPFNISGDFKVNGLVCDRSGWFLVKGKIRRLGEDEEDFSQVAFMVWRDDGTGAPVLENDDDVLLIVERWEDPRLVGEEFETFTSAWALGVLSPHEIIPLGVFSGYFGNIALGQAHKIIGRIMLSSGTATAWAGFIPPAAGINAPANDDNEKFMASDLEIQDMGLNIPAAQVDFDSLFAEADALEGGPNWQLNRWQYAAVGPVQSDDLISWLCQGRAWAISWKKGPTDKSHRFGIFSPFRTLSPNETEITITDQDLAGEVATPESWLPSQSLRWEAPIDRFKVEAAHRPSEGSSAFDIEVKSMDPGLNARDGFQVFEITDLGLTNPEQWRDSPQQAEYTWNPDSLRTRFQEGVGTWYEKRHFPITLTVRGPKAHLCGVGTIIRYTDTSRPASPHGVYGLTGQMGRVVEVVQVLRKGDLYARHAEITILMQSVPTTQVRVWSGIARVSDFDLATGELFCDGDGRWDGDWLEHGGSQSDVVPFTIQVWMSGSGNAEVKILQSEDRGNTWGGEVTADVVSVNTTTHVITVTNIVGTLLRDTDKILLFQGHSIQATDWVQSSFSVITNPDGTFAGATQGFKLK